MKGTNRSLQHSKTAIFIDQQSYWWQIHLRKAYHSHPARRETKTNRPASVQVPVQIPWKVKEKLPSAKVYLPRRRSKEPCFVTHHSHKWLKRNWKSIWTSFPSLKPSQRVLETRGGSKGDKSWVNRWTGKRTRQIQNALLKWSEDHK